MFRGFWLCPRLHRRDDLSCTSFSDSFHFTFCIYSRASSCTHIITAAIQSKHRYLVNILNFIVTNRNTFQVVLYTRLWVQRTKWCHVSWKMSSVAWPECLGFSFRAYSAPRWAPFHPYWMYKQESYTWISSDHWISFDTRIGIQTIAWNWLFLFLARCRYWAA